MSPTCVVMDPFLYKIGLPEVAAMLFVAKSFFNRHLLSEFGCPSPNLVYASLFCLSLVVRVWLSESGLPKFGSPSLVCPELGCPSSVARVWFVRVCTIRSIFCKEC